MKKEKKKAVTQRQVSEQLDTNALDELNLDQEYLLSGFVSHKVHLSGERVKKRERERSNRRQVEKDTLRVGVERM